MQSLVFVRRLDGLPAAADADTAAGRALQQFGDAVVDDDGRLLRPEALQERLAALLSQFVQRKTRDVIELRLDWQTRAQPDTTNAELQRYLRSLAASFEDWMAQSIDATAVAAAASLAHTKTPAYLREVQTEVALHCQQASVHAAHCLERAGTLPEIPRRCPPRFAPRCP